MTIMNYNETSQSTPDSSGIPYWLQDSLFPPSMSPSLDIIQEVIDVTTNRYDSTTISGEIEPYVPYHERPETYIVPLLFLIIFIIGVLGNGTLILIFIKHRTMRNVPNMYICSLAVGDILVIFFCVPFTSTVYTVDSWPYGVVVCKFSEFIKDVSIGVSVFTLTALSADRYFAIVDPMRKIAGRRATRITCLTIVGIWVVSILISLPSAMFSYVKTFNGTNHVFLVCYPFPEDLGPLYPKGMVLFKALVYYFVPLILIASFYIVMAHHLVLSTRNMPGEAQSQGQGQGRQVQARKKVAKMVLSFVVIFAMCFFLSHVFMLWFYFTPDAEEKFNTFWHVIRILGFCLSFLNSCINPITLYCVSGTFRKLFNRHLFCCVTSSRHTHVRHHLLCCPSISRIQRQAHHRQSYMPASYNSEGGALSCGGDLNGSTRVNGHGHRGIPTMTSTTSLRAKVTWDASQSTKSPGPSSKQSGNNYLMVEMGNSRRQKSLSLPKPSNEDRFHLYPNPTRKLPSVDVVHVPGGGSSGTKETEYTMTSFIESDANHKLLCHEESQLNLR